MTTLLVNINQSIHSFSASAENSGFEGKFRPIHPRELSLFRTVGAGLELSISRRKACVLFRLEMEPSGNQVMLS